LFSEVIDNSIDEGLKTNFKFSNKISITINDKEITITDNGRGLNCDWDETHSQYKSVLAFTKLRAGSNFDKTGNTIGRFGVGVSLTNILSKEFSVISTNTNNEKIVLNCKNNASEIDVKKSTCKSAIKGTSIRYILDFDYFKIEKYTEEIISLIHKRILDLAMIFPQIEFKWNGKKVYTNNFREYVKRIGEDFIIHEDENSQFAILPSPSDTSSNISFAKGIETVRGGSHVEYILTNLYYVLRPMLQKKYKINITPSDVRSKFLIIINCKNLPELNFDSQMKEKLTITNSLAKYISIPKNFYSKILLNKTMIDPLIELYMLKKELENKQIVENKQKTLKKKKIPKLIEASSKDRSKCTLFLTEGDSALGQLIGVRDREHHAGLPLRGKVLNVFDCNHKEVLSNVELQDIMACVGLSLSNKKVDGLRYGKIVLLQDADPDGNCISGLLLNFFYKFWPELFEKKMIVKYLSPIIVAKKKKEIKKYFSFEEFEKDRDKLNGWELSYKKGLGSLDEKEYSEMINQPVEYVFTTTDVCSESLNVVFGNSTDKRKEWLS
jgi:DNA gyrase/topoisomerase IV subunit B